MNIDEISDKIPTVQEIVDSGEKVADKFEEKPTGSFVYIILVLLGAFTVYQHFDKKDVRKQLADCQEKNDYYSRTSFNYAMENKILKNTVTVQDTAIKEAKSYLQDSVKVVYKLKSNQK